MLDIEDLETKSLIPVNNKGTNDQAAHLHRLISICVVNIGIKHVFSHHNSQFSRVLGCKYIGLFILLKSFIDGSNNFIDGCIQL